MSRALVLMYHAIDVPRARAENGYCVRPDAFAAQMAWLAKSGHNIVSCGSVIEALLPGGAPVPESSIAVTFDDGLDCFARNALPVLALHGLPATLFAVAGKLGATNDWDAGIGLPARRLLGAAELRAAASAGIDIGCHGRMHRHMTLTTDDELRDETATARDELSQAVGRDVRLFAYPYGQHGRRERAAVQEAGFRGACSTMPGFTGPGADPFAVRRIDIYGTDDLATFKRKVAFGANKVGIGDLAKYYAGRLSARLHG